MYETNWMRIFGERQDFLEQSIKKFSKLAEINLTKLNCIVTALKHQTDFYFESILRWAELSLKLSGLLPFRADI